MRVKLSQLSGAMAKKRRKKKEREKKRGWEGRGIVAGVSAEWVERCRGCYGSQVCGHEHGRRSFTHRACLGSGGSCLPPSLPLSLSLSLGVYLYTEGGGTRGNEWPTYFIIDSDKFRSSIMTCKH